jgi:fructose-1,6-bisphosphatase/inositol monophosphatase family enzyme
VNLPAGASGQDALDVARECAAAAGGVIRDGFRKATVSNKGGRRNVVTEADLAAEEVVRMILAREFPGHALLAEEGSSGAWSDGWMWVCDPIDGTKNYSRGIPHFAFSIALCHDGAPVLGLTTHPLLDWEIAAVRGRGCTWNGAPAGVSRAAALEEAVVAIDLGFDGARGQRQLEAAARLWPRVETLRVAGSAALGFAYVAIGAWDLYLHSNLSPWDIAAGIVLVEEAGGTISHRDGSAATLATPAAVAGTAGLHAEFLSLDPTVPWE